MPIVTESFGIPRQRLIAKVAEILRATPEITLLRLDPGAAGPLRFRAGQYAQLTFGALPPRDYSIGSRPDEALLEFHIRDTGDGGSSTYVSRELREGEAVTVEGPFGRCFLQDDEPGPVLAIAGGSGLAPMKSIIATALTRGFDGEIHLYFGVRRNRDVYLEEQLQDLSKSHSKFSFDIVVSDEHPAEGYRPGLVTDAIAQDHGALSASSAYMAGPPPMVAATSRLLLQRGLSTARLYADPFLTEAELASQDQDRLRSNRSET